MLFSDQSGPNPLGLDWILSPADWSIPFHALSEKSLLPPGDLLVLRENEIS